MEVEAVARAWAIGSDAQADVEVFALVGSEACVDVVEETIPAATELLCFAVYARQRDGLVGTQFRCRCATRMF